MAKKKVKKKKPAVRLTGAKYVQVRVKLRKVLDEAKERFGTDASTSRKLGRSENYVSSLRHDATRNKCSFDKMNEATIQVWKLISATDANGRLLKSHIDKSIDLEKVVKKVKAKKSSKKKVVKRHPSGPHNWPGADPESEKVTVRIGDMTYTHGLPSNSTIDITIERGKNKILARI